jgi:hypothetical protein
MVDKLTHKASKPDFNLLDCFIEFPFCKFAVKNPDFGQFVLMIHPRKRRPNPRLTILGRSVSLLNKTASAKPLDADDRGVDVKTLIQTCDLELRQGRAGAGLRALKTVNLAAVAREDRLPLAGIFRRANLFTSGLKLLTPLIFSERNKWKSEATPDERAEYAALLSKNGNNSEALSVLRKLRVADAPLYRAFCHMANWDYDSARAELEEYLRAQPLGYAAAIARVNLAACLVGSADWERAGARLAGNIAEAEDNGFRRLLANNLELRAQMHLRQRRWRDAGEDLNRASATLAADGTSDSLFISKWKAILRGLEQRSEEPILAFRQAAVERGHWESARDADRFLLMVRFEEKRFRHLLFGTPFASFREQLCGELERYPEEKTYRYGSESGPALDLLTGEFSPASPLQVKPNHLRLLRVLAADFYRPVKLGALFSKLFPGDHFDVYSSPNRVHQMFWRARGWLGTHRLPLNLTELSGDYRLTVDSGFALLVPLNWRDEGAPWLEKIRRHFAGREFTAAEACSVLSISRSGFLRRSQEAVARGELAKRFQGPAVKYRAA